MKREFTIIVPEEQRGWGEHKRTLPKLVATVEVYVDESWIAQHIGSKAARSKGKRSKALSGHVKVKVLKVKESL